MINLPNPFSSTLASAMTVESAAAPHLTDPAVAAADYLPSVTPARAPTTAAAGANAAAAFFASDHRFRLDERAFWEAIEPPPLFLQRVSA